MKRRNIRDPAASGNGGDAQPIGKPWAINHALTEDLILINYIWKLIKSIPVIKFVEQILIWTNI